MAGYRAIHIWINTHYPRTGRCEYCGRTDRKTEYATARRGVYTRNRADWFEFCYHCHSDFDGRSKLTAAQVAEIRAIRWAALEAAPLRHDGRRRVRVPGGVALREELGRRYGVTADMIKHIWGGRSWVA